MPFNFDEFITLGRHLDDPHSSYAQLRTSISRGYYGVYHKVIKKLNLHGRNKVQHTELIAELRNSEFPSYLSKLLGDLYWDRVKSDYKPFEDIDKSTTRIFWERLDNLLNKLEEDS